MIKFLHRDSRPFNTFRTPQFSQKNDTTDAIHPTALFLDSPSNRELYVWLHITLTLIFV